MFGILTDFDLPFSFTGLLQTRDFRLTDTTSISESDLCEFEVQNMPAASVWTVNFVVSFHTRRSFESRACAGRS